MALALVWVKHPDELRADFQEYYGLNLDGLGTEYTFDHAAALVTQLRQGSRVCSVLDKDGAWDKTDTLLACIADMFQLYMYSRTKDAKYKRNIPTMIGPSSLTDALNENKKIKRKGIAMTPAQLDARLAKPRT